LAEIAVEPLTPFPPGSAKNEMTVKFRAPAAGELFVFVNDAYSGIFPIGLFRGRGAENEDGSWRHDYGDNKGSARVTVRRAHSDLD
jgi:hypothetical protein